MDNRPANGLKTTVRKSAAGAELRPQPASCALHYHNKLSQHMLRRTTQSAERKTTLWMCQMSTPELCPNASQRLMTRQVFATKTFFVTAKNEDNVTADEAALARLANGAAAGGAGLCGGVLCLKSVRLRMAINTLNQMKHHMRYCVRCRIRCRAENIR